MVRLGQKINFIPSWGINRRDDEEGIRQKTVVGTFTHINYAHGFFVLTYKVRCGRTLRESFKFCDYPEGA